MVDTLEKRLNRRNFLKVAAGALIGGAATYYFGHYISPYRRKNLEGTVTKTITTTDTKIITETITKDKIVTQTKTLIPKQPVFGDASVYRSNLNFNIEFNLTDPTDSYNPGMESITGIVMHPDRVTQLPVEVLSIGNDRYSMSFQPEKIQVGEYSITIQGKDKEGFSIDEKLLSSKYPALEVAVTQNERLASNNPTLLDSIFESMLLNRSNYLEGLDREDMFRKTYPFVKGRNSLNDGSIDTLIAHSATDNTYSNDIVNSLLDIVETNPEIVSGFDSVRKYDNLLKLLEHVPNISKYPKELREGAIKVDEIIYKNNLATSENDEMVWNSFVGPAVNHIISGIDRGEINYEFDIPDKNLEALARRDRLLPIELLDFNIVTGEYSGPLNLNLGIYNVSPDQNLGGKSPQEWLRDFLREQFEKKGEWYNNAIEVGKTSHSSFQWPETQKAWEKTYDMVLEEDPVAAYIIGASRSNGGWNDLREADTDNYASLISRAMGGVSFDMINNHPNSSGVHGEPFIVVNSNTYDKIVKFGEENGYGKPLLPHMFGWWQFLGSTGIDHEGAKNPLNPRIKWRDLKWEPFLNQN